MKNLLAPLTKQFNSFRNSIEPILGFLTFFIGILASLTKFLESKYNIAIICVGVFILIKMMSNEIIRSKKESFGIITNKYSSRNIRLAKVLGYMNYSFLFFPLFLIVSALIPSSYECQKNVSKYGVIITSFSKSDDDDFSYKLFNSLEAELQNMDTVILCKSKNVITTSEKNYMDSIKQNFEKNCLEKGILVFGKRNWTSKLFDCKIYINKLFDFDHNQKKNFIYIENPDLINFSIDYQANTISDFVMGLLYYHTGNNKFSKFKFNRCLKLNSKNNQRFKSFCYLFLGNISFSEKDYESANSHYLMGISQDSSNVFLHFNLATCSLINGNVKTAKNEYQFANTLNKDIINPLSKNTKSEKLTSDTKPKILLQPVNHPLRKDSANVQHNEMNTSQVSVNYRQVNINSLYGVLNRQNDTVVKCQYNSIRIFLHNGKTFFIVQNNNKYGALTENAKTSIPIVHASAEYVQYLIKNVL